MAWLRARPRRMGSFTDPSDPGILASAKAMRGGEGGAGSPALPTRTGWENEAWGYFDANPNIHYVVDFKARCFSRIRFRPGWRNDDGDVVPITDKLLEENPEIAKLLPLTRELLRTFRSRRGGQGGLLFRIGQIKSVAADGWLLPEDVFDAKTVDPSTGQKARVDRFWEFLSKDELRKAGPSGQWERHRGPGVAPEKIPAGVEPIRVWSQHPRYSHLSNSQLRPLLDTLEVLTLSIKAERGHILSRLTGPGILLVDQDIDFPDDPNAPETESGDPFGVRLTTAMATPIGDRASAGSFAPIVIRCDLDAVEKGMKRVTFDSPQETASIAKRIEMVERIAQGVDLPFETVVGHTQTTFNNAGQIDEDLYNQHLKPDVDDVAEDVIWQYLVPSLMAAAGIEAGMSPPEPFSRMAIWADASMLVAPKDRSKVATDGFRDFMLSAEAWRRYCGFSEDDKPGLQEVLQRIWLTQHLGVRETIRANEMESTGSSPSLVLPTTPGVMPGSENMTDEEIQAEVDKAVADAAAQAQAGAAAQAAAQADLSAKGEDIVASGGRVHLVNVLGAAALMAVEQAVDHLGARLKDLARADESSRLKDPAASTRFRPEWGGAVLGLSNVRVVEHLPKVEILAAIPQPELFAGEFSVFTRTVEKLLTEARHAEPAAAARRVTALARQTAERRLDGVALVDPAAIVAALKSKVA